MENTKKVNRNTREGLCFACGKIVKVGEGFFRKKSGVWKVRHINCYDSNLERR